MKRLGSMGFSLILLLSVDAASVFSQSAEDDFFQPWVEYSDGAISVAFTQVPVEFALYAIHARTGFQIIVPREAHGKTLNLRLRALPLELAMRSLIRSIGFTSFAFTYDRNGRPLRAIILEARQNEPDPPSDADKPAASPPLTAAETEQLTASLKLWKELKDDDRGRIEERLRSLAPSEQREELLKEYGRQILGIKE
jgi:hypothetical protein